MRSLERLRLAVALFVFTVCCLLAARAHAYAGAVANGSSTDGTPGYITSSQWGGGSSADGTPADDGGGCRGCHGTANGNGPTGITLTGPGGVQALLDETSIPGFTMKAGTDFTFTLNFSNAAGKFAGGFLVMHNDTSANNAGGTLSSVDGSVHQCTGVAGGGSSTSCNSTFNNNTEVMHEIPKAGSNVSFNFKYTANASVACTTHNFAIWINSVNSDNLCFNASDFPVYRQFSITTNCDDGNLCTNDSCSGVSCINSANSNACNDGNSCTTGDVCSGGGCAGNPIICNPLDQCHSAGTCSGGVCSQPLRGDGTVCNDGNACTTGDACNGGACTGNPIVCTASDTCHSAGTCSGGICSNPVKGNGASCNDGQACTANDMCSNGVCVGGAIGCTAQDQCHDVGTCSGGVCSNPTKPNGTTCNDGNPCTTGDSCSGGSCTGAPIVCTALDQCHDVGTCSGGVCSNPNKANGSGCNDGKVCTTPDSCTNGVCGGPAKNCNDGITCTVDSCKEASGGCVNDTSTCGCTKNADCDDKNPCNGVETCNLTTLTCAGGPPIDCSAMNDACNTGTCVPASGACTKSPKANGLGCNDGNACTTGDACTAGKCSGAAIVCTASDSCHTAGTCSGGVCSNPTKGDGTSCNDSNPCTTGETCAGGVCRGGSAVVCNDGNPCSVDSCNPSTGCAASPGNSGAQCSPPSCKGGKETHASTCNGSSATCPPPVGKDCAPYACGATACLTACTVETDCAAGNYCAAGGKCTPKITPGGVCSAGAQCTTSFCVDGVCCNNSCVGQCEACNLPNKPGTCSPTTGKPIAPRAACIGNGTGCDGACNGVLTTACTVPGQSKQCRGPSCNASTATATLPEFCDGSGKCPAVRTQACAPGVCGAAQCTGCSTNAECPTGDFCRGGVCKPQSAPSAKCSIDVECASGHCVDGVCCNTDCAGQCEACNQDGKVGTCTPIPAGQPPAEGRPGCAGADTQCGGVCDGTITRNCAYPGPGVICRQPSCMNGSATLAAFCDGSGSCPPPSEQACPANADCVGDLCGGAPESCISDAECTTTEYCAGGVCAPKNIAGTACNTAAECNSGICVDGVCCTKACTGQCEACNAEGHEGTCIPITGSPRGSRQACSSDGTVCGGSCDGANATRCAYEGATTQCRPGTCKNDLADLAAFCQGDGSCAPLQQQSCDAFGCNATAVQCKGGCDGNKACPAGQYCSAGICIKVLNDGLTCGASSQCKNGHCVDGVCCNSDCTGSCEACDQVDHLGTCVAVNGAPRNGRAACNGSGACGGFCAGVSECAFPGSNTPCGTSYCAVGVTTDTPSCNGNATCIVPAPTSCDPYQCDPGGDVCLTTCAIDADCASGLVCKNSFCTQPTPDAGVDAGRDSGPAGAGGAGNGGAAGTGGAETTTGGAGGRAGGSNTGGAVGPVDGGMRPDASDAGSPPPVSGGGGGCNCRTASPAENGPSAALVALAGFALFAARRRRTGALPDLR